jgi:hypothetical protein
MLIIEDPYLTVKCRTVIHTLFIYFNLCLSVKCSFTSISFHSKTKTNQARKADFKGNLISCERNICNSFFIYDNDKTEEISSFKF